MTDTSNALTADAPSPEWTTLGNTAAVASAPAAAPFNIPPFPQGFGWIFGQMEITCDTKVAVVQLPEALKGVSCAGVFAVIQPNPDCHNPKDVCAGGVVRVRALNNREFEVTTDATGDRKMVGLGWVPDPYGGGQLPKTRAVKTGVPVVKVLVILGPECGPCEDENWKPANDWGQP